MILRSQALWGVGWGGGGKGEMGGWRVMVWKISALKKNLKCGC